MKNVFIVAVVAFFIVSFLGCTRCYTCTNACTVCRQQHPDTTFAIVFCSTTLSEQYYVQYLDSLSNWGWTCADTTSTINEKFCDQRAQSNGDITNKSAQGYRCSSD
jgi:hypothetical protein